MDTIPVNKKNLREVFTPFVMKLLVIMFLVEFVKGALLLSVLPVYLGSVLGASAFIIGWSLSVQYLGDNLMRTPSGWLIDKLGYRVCMLSGVAVTFVSVFLISFSANYYLVVLACALLGIGTAPLWPGVISGTTATAGDNSRGTIMSVVYMAWLIGTGSGPVLINLFIKGNNYSLALRILMGMMAVVVMVALFLPRRSVNAAGPRAAISALHDMKGAEIRVPVKQRITAYLTELKASLNYSRWLYPALFAQTFALGLLTPILTLYARTVMHLTPNEYSLFLIAGGGVTVGLMVPVGKMVDKRGTGVTLTLGCAISALSMLVFPWVHNRLGAFLLVVILGFGYALLIPSWNALIASLVPPEKKGSIWGFFLTIEGAGMIIGPIAAGILWERIGSHAPFMASGAVLMLLLIMTRLVSNKRENMIR